MLMSIHYNMYNTMRLSIIGLVLGLGSFGLTPDYLKVVISAACSVTIGLVLQLALLWDKGKLTTKRAVIQSVFSMGVGYYTFFWLEGADFAGMKRHVVLGLFSFIAGYVIPAIDQTGKVESKNIVQAFFDKALGIFHVLTAKKKDGDNKPENN